MDANNTPPVEPVLSQANNTSQKRKAPKAQGAGPAQKKQRAQARPRRTRAQARTEAAPNNTIHSYFATSAAPTAGDETTLSNPAGTPPISSNIRAALCDSIDYWKAHQGGIQSCSNVATGMLLNGKTTPRDVLQAQVIITTVGGGLKTGPDGKHIRTEDQKEDCKNYIVLKNAMELGHPIGIVVGKQAQEKHHYANNLLDIKLENHFNVLDFFFITDIWSEKQPTQQDGTSFMHFAVRLQRIDLNAKSWWVPKGNERRGMHSIGEQQCCVITCQQCQVPSKAIFKEGWCCLQKTCPEFFRFASPNVDINTLQYNDNFLNMRTEWISDFGVPDLVPGLLLPGLDEYGSEAKFKRGIICPVCRFAIRRVSWEGWVCEQGCGFKLMLPPKDVPMALVHRETKKAMGRKAKFTEVDARIRHTSHVVEGYEVTTFYLPNAPQDLHEAEFIGSVTVLRPTQSTLERKGGLNDLFNELQQATRTGEVKLQRNPAFCRGSHMEELTSHFSCNMGADYKFGVVVETSNGFETAPDPVMKALSRLTWGGAAAVKLTAEYAAQNNLSFDSASMPNEFIDFNEQLMLGYFEGSQISFHDDGEKELGPTVATLSLGSPSTMRFRGKKKAGFESTSGAGGVMLSFCLEHGDIVIMHGTKIHKHYEHAVTASGIRRYALTCRYIRPEMIPDPARREKAIVNGRVPTFWQKQAYKGESPEALASQAHDADAVPGAVDASLVNGDAIDAENI
ncbi:hypothetical protein F5Y14DRAFT_451367 [Nemania sp. NC0429]|nr:hypothetical protein F5Y14DRAFT_451367 [Nemania sp. NC0429]